MPETVELSLRLKALFRTTKLVCFGRYALEVPREAQAIPGPVWFPSDVHIHKGGLEDAKRRVNQRITELRWSDKTTEITYNEAGPVHQSWQLQYYEDAMAKKFGLFSSDTYVVRDGVIFFFEDGAGDGESESEVVERQSKLVKSLRLRGADEVPTDPGFCIERGFLASDRYDHQEMVNAGIYLPTFPDVTFSITSNKDAYSNYPAAEFEGRLRAKLSLLNRIQSAHDAQGSHYPRRRVLREGKRDVQHWHGEESLIVRPDGVHDFEWAFVGTPRDVANPSEYSVHMRTKVEHNMVGAAAIASLSDEEAVALWDRLLAGLKYRVKVPGAPEGSYHLPTTTSATARD